jgi:hypothetical protein
MQLSVWQNHNLAFEIVDLSLKLYALKKKKNTLLPMIWKCRVSAFSNHYFLKTEIQNDSFSVN